MNLFPALIDCMCSVQNNRNSILVALFYHIEDRTNDGQGEFFILSLHERKIYLRYFVAYCPHVRDDALGLLGQVYNERRTGKCG